MIKKYMTFIVNFDYDDVKSVLMMMRWIIKKILCIIIIMELLYKKNKFDMNIKVHDLFKYDFENLIYYIMILNK